MSIGAPQEVGGVEAKLGVLQEAEDSERLGGESAAEGRNPGSVVEKLVVLKTG